MDSGCGGVGGINHFGYNPQEKQQLQQQHLQQLQNLQQRNQNPFFENGSLVSATKNHMINAVTFNSHLAIMQHSHSIASQFEIQRQEIDQYIRIQVRYHHTNIFTSIGVFPKSIGILLFCPRHYGLYMGN